MENPDHFEGRSDAELLRLALAGQESAFLVLYERLKGGIFRYAFYMTNSRTAAEEVTQEVFISLLNQGSHYREDRGDVGAFALELPVILFTGLAGGNVLTSLFPKTIHSTDNPGLFCQIRNR